MTADATNEAIIALWRTEAPRVVGMLARIVRDVGLAEELAQDALVAALEDWPRNGVPERPAAWLVTTAKRRALNALKRVRMTEQKHALLGHELPTRVAVDQLEEALDTMHDEIGDEVLRLVFVACHPVIPREARVALTLRLVAGLTTAEIAHAFLVPETTIGQRIVRAKRTLAEAQVPFEVPRGAELAPRLASVLEVVYLIFNEGYSASGGGELMRPILMADALRLGELIVRLAPDEPEAHGLVALMHLSASRAPARTDAAGDPVLLEQQDRTRWDATKIAAAFAALVCAEALGRVPGAYELQAAIAACHARARHADETDWPRIAALYGELARVAPSPVVELNRALAVSRAEGPAAGLALLEPLTSDRALTSYHLLPAARADLLERLGRRAEARAEFERAAELADNARLRDRLLARARRMS